MRVTLNIQDHKAEAFLAFIKTLDFISVNKEESNEDHLSEAQKQEINNRIDDYLENPNELSDWKDVKNRLLNS